MNAQEVIPGFLQSHFRLKEPPSLPLNSWLPGEIRFNKTSSATANSPGMRNVASSKFKPQESKPSKAKFKLRSSYYYSTRRGRSFKHDHWKDEMDQDILDKILTMPSCKKALHMFDYIWMHYNNISHLIPVNTRRFDQRNFWTSWTPLREADPEGAVLVEPKWRWNKKWSH